MATPVNPIEVRPVQVQNKARKAIYFNNRELHLAGIFPGVDRLDGNFNTILDKLSTRDNNFFRQYLTAYFHYRHDVEPIQTPTGEDQRQRYSPFFWHKPDDPDPTKRQKWDLTRFNEDYFKRLRAMLNAARGRGIVVQLILFDGAGIGPVNRFKYHPWNAARNINGVVAGASGLATFLTRRDLPAKDSNGQPTTTLGKIQDEFIRQVVTRTLDFWNVVFEVMNEPTQATPAARARWADTIVGVINRYTKGRRLIFYNDHSQYAEDVDHPGGADVNHWRTLPNSNYRALDGVILHGDPNLVRPETAQFQQAWKFVGEKVIQASSDTYTTVNPETGGVYREESEWNRTTASAMFARHVVYQAEAGEGGRMTAADGIKLAKPTEILYSRLLGNWDKLAPTPPSDYYLRFDANGRYFAIRRDDDVVIDRGRLVRFSATQFFTIRDGETAERSWDYEMSADGQSLAYGRAGSGVKNFQYRRFSGAVEAFLYGWKRVGADTAGEGTPLLLYFRQDNTFATRDVQNPQTVVNYGRILTLTDDPPRMVIESTPINNLQTPFLYSFFDHGRTLRLFNERRQTAQYFERTAEGLPV